MLTNIQFVALYGAFVLYQRGLIYEVHKQKEKFIAWGLMKPLFNEREISYKAIIVSNKSIRQM